MARKREIKNRTLVKSSVFEVPAYVVKIELEIHKKETPYAGMNRTGSMSKRTPPHSQPISLTPQFLY